MKGMLRVYVEGVSQRCILRAYIGCTMKVYM